MRFRPAKCATLVVVLLNLLVLYYSWRLFVAPGYLRITFDGTGNTTANKTAPRPLKRISKLVTIIIAHYSHADNDVTGTVLSLLKIFPNLQILVLSRTRPYPPLRLHKLNVTRNVRLLTFEPDLDSSFGEQYPLFHVRTKYALFIPDGVRVINRHVLQGILNTGDAHNASSSASASASVRIVAIPIAHSCRPECYNVSLALRNWSLALDSGGNPDSAAGGGEPRCDVVGGSHAVLIERQILRRLPNAFMLPHPHAMYLQTSHFRYDIQIHKDSNVFAMSKPNAHRPYHQQWKLDQETKKHLHHLYSTFGIKYVRKNHNIEWYGCSKETVHCFYPILNGIPSYIHAKKNTPPCCMANLRKTAHQVFNALETAGIRYWIDAGSLLGAMRYNDIIPWDFNVDVAIHRDDLMRSKVLAAATVKPVIDFLGYLWEKQYDNGLYRVHYSKKNKIYVNVFLFYARNGTMVTDAAKHREFPERFLHPMSSIEFLGRFVPTPNNIHDYLELQLGKDFIENFQRPDPAKMWLLV